MLTVSHANSLTTYWSNKFLRVHSFCSDYFPFISTKLYKYLMHLIVDENITIYISTSISFFNLSIFLSSSNQNTFCISTICLTTSSLQQFTYVIKIQQKKKATKILFNLVKSPNLSQISLSRKSWNDFNMWFSLSLS